MALFYHVVGPRYDEGRHSQRSKTRWIDSRLVNHQAKKLQLTFVTSSESLLVLLVNFSTRLLGKAFWEQVSAIKHKASDTLGMLERKQQSNVGSIREAQYVGRIYSEFVHETSQVKYKLSELKRCCSPR